MANTYSAEALEEVDDCMEVDVLLDALIEVASLLAIVVADHESTYSYWRQRRSSSTPLKKTRRLWKNGSKWKWFL
jgi:hypothetical protein